MIKKGPCIVQLGFWPYEWLTKLDDREMRVRFANPSWHDNDILLPINYNY